MESGHLCGLKMKGNTLTKRTSAKRPLAFAALGALALGLFGATGASAAAGPDYGNIDPAATGSITIHKHEYQDPGNTIIGQPDEATTLPKPLAGAKFSVTKIASIGGVNIDLNSNTGWAALDGVTAQPDCSVASAVLGTSQETTATDATGVVKLADLPVGAYLVCETVTPEGVSDKASPFIVTVPYPHHTGSAATNDESAKWVYDVHVYPKNSRGGIVKDIATQQDFTLGATVEFPVTADVRRIDGSEYFTYFSILDNFDSRLTPNTPAVSSVKVDGTAVSADFYKVVTKGQKAYVVFSNEGLNWLTANAQGKSVEVVFSATVTGVGNGTIKNVASLYTDTDSTKPVPGDPTDPTNPGPDPENPVTPGDPSDPTDPNYPGDPSDPFDPTPSNEVETVWGSVTLKKADSGDDTTGLSGAKFAVYESANPYAATCSATPLGDAVELNGTALTVVSGANGAISIPGLFVKDTNTGAGSSHRCYVLVETEAPGGYALPSGDDAKTALTVTAGPNDLSGTPILNTKREFPFLPNTGAAGQLLLTLGGIAGVAVATGLLLVRRKKQAQN